ncbi:MAG: hypothetical protein KDD01_06655 [Phaeodactylibacter sp.]|nr:hypothetical protein [Phaeodactylibacter sp.]
MSNQFDTIIEGQKKAMEFWSNLSEQMTKAFTPETNGKSKSTDDAQDLFTEWYKKQQDFFEQAVKVGQDPQKALEKAPEQMRQWMEMQTEYAQKWAKFYQDNAEKMGLKLPEYQGAFNPSGFFQDGMKSWKEWMNKGNKWMSEQVYDKMPYSMRPHFTNFVESYDYMHRYWEPMQRLIQNGMYTKEMIDKYFSPDSYQKVVNQMMGFRPVGNTSELIENVNKWFETYLSYTKNEAGDWSSISDNWKEKMREYMDKGNMPFFEMATDFNNRMRDQLAPYYNIMAQGRQTEVAKMMRDIQFAYIAFILKSAELQSMVYEAGQFSMPDTIRDFYKKYKDSKEMPEYQDFFQHYVNTLEDTLLKVLHSEEYSKLQSEVAAAGTGIKSMTDKIMELTYADLPFLTKSDGDDIAKESNALRQKMRKLEQKVAELEKALLLAGKPMVSKGEEVTETKGTSKKKLIDKIGKASKAQADDLKQIKGIGPKLEKMLNELGVYSYNQISKMTAREYDMIDELLGAFQGRAKRDQWAKQAKSLL